MILISGKENPFPYNPEPTPILSNTANNAFNRGAKAQLKKVVKWLVEKEVDNECEDCGIWNSQNFAIPLKDWRELLKEIA